jgi:hypothetical protein
VVAISRQRPLIRSRVPPTAGEELVPPEHGIGLAVQRSGRRAGKAGSLHDEAGHVDAAVAQFPLDGAPGQLHYVSAGRGLRPENRQEPGHRYRVQSRTGDEGYPAGGLR